MKRKRIFPYSKLTLAWVVFLVASYAQVAAAQFVRVSGTYVPDSDVSFLSTVNDAVEPDPVARVETAEISAALNLPIKLGAQSVLVVGASYGLLFADQESNSLLFGGSREFHAVAVVTTLSHRFDDKWSMLLRAGAGLSSDFIDLDVEESFRGQFGAILSYQLETNLRIGGGIFVGNSLGELAPLPALLLNWQVSETVALDFVFPLNLDLRWTPFERLELGLSATLTGDAYQLSPNRGRDAWPCSEEPADFPGTTYDETEADPNRCLTRLSTSRADIGPYLGVRLGGGLWFQVQASVPAFRRFEFLNEDGETPDVGDLELDRNVVLSARLELRFPPRAGSREGGPTRQ